MKLNDQDIKLVEEIHGEVSKLLNNNATDEYILMAMTENIKTLRSIMQSSKINSLDYYCEKYDGFFYFMRLLENIAGNLSKRR